MPLLWAARAALVMAWHSRCTAPVQLQKEIADAPLFNRGLDAYRIPEKGEVQKLALAFWSFHYIKRILETFFVHK